MGRLGAPPKIREGRAVDVGTVLYMLGLAYGLGLLWYSVLPTHVPEHVWRVAAYPFATMAFGEAFGAALKIGGPTFGTIHVLTALVATFVGVVIDWAITQARHPSLIAEPRASVMAQR